MNDPFLNIFEEGTEEFLTYRKEKGENYKTKAQKHKEKIAKLERDLNDAELKKQRNRERRQAEKAKIHKVMEGMTEEEVQKFIHDRKEKREE